MPLYMIERTFAEQLELTSEDVELIDELNADEGVRWLFSFLSADRRRTYCLYEAPSPEAIRRGRAPGRRSRRRDRRGRRRPRRSSRAACATGPATCLRTRWPGCSTSQAEVQGVRRSCGHGQVEDRLWSTSSAPGLLDQSRAVELARSRVCCTPLHSR